MISSFCLQNEQLSAPSSNHFLLMPDAGLWCQCQTASGCQRKVPVLQGCMMRVCFVMLSVSFSMQYFYTGFIKLFHLCGFVLDSELHSLPQKSWSQWNPPQFHSPPERTHRALQKGGHEEYLWAFSPSHKKAQQTPMDLDWHFKSYCFLHFLKCWQRRSHMSRCEDPQLPAQTVLEGRGGWKKSVLCCCSTCKEQPGALRGLFPF